MRILSIFFFVMIHVSSVFELNAQQLDSTAIDCSEKLHLVRVSPIKSVVIHNGNRLSTEQLIERAKDREELKIQARKAGFLSAFSMITGAVGLGMVGYEGTLFVVNQKRFNPLFLGVGAGLIGISALSRNSSSNKLGDYVRHFNRTQELKK